MAVVDDFTSVVPARQAARSRVDVLRSGWRAFSRAIAAGSCAAAEYHRLSQLSDRQLRVRGLARSDIPQELHRRHFASLAGWLDAID